jgi:GNAT superfamily N-acetyltransferase
MVARWRLAEDAGVLSIRAMTPLDLALGLRLKAQAGWNQTEADWRRVLELEPSGCFVAEWDGTPVGTTATCVFGHIAWVSMVLVDEAWRGRGIGTALLQHALAWLDERGVKSIRLDATPLGRPVYEKLGFVAEHTLARYAGTVPPLESVWAVAPARPEHLEGMLRLDRGVTATNRAKLLTRLYREAPESWRVVSFAGGGSGFIGMRPGATALHVGPCVASPDVGALLLQDVLHRHTGTPVYLDIPTSNQRATRFVEALGLTVQRHLLRMSRGVRVVERLDELWAGFGPEKG